MTDDRPAIDLNTAADIATAVPFLIGYQPNDALVLLAFHQRDLFFSVAASLAKLRDDSDAGSLTAILHGKTIDQVSLVGYGPHDTVTTATRHVVRALTQHPLALPAPSILRVHDGRVWHLTATGRQTPAEGIPFDPNTSALAAQAVYHGLTAAPDRDTLVAGLAPITGTEQQAMAHALAAADLHLQAITDGPIEAATVRIEQLLDNLLTETKAAYRTGRLPDDRAALLILLLTTPALVDRAIGHVYGSDADIQIWTDLTRRAGTTLAAGPAVLLALAALQTGKGAHAKIAFERAHGADPDNEFLEVIRGLLLAGVNPQVLHRTLHN